MTELSGRRPTDPGRVAAVVLAGGTAARMDGADKAAIELRGVTLLERTLSATFTAVEVVVVGDPVPTTRPVTFTVEDPRGGGPAAGLLAGLRAFYRPPDLVMVLAVDMPRVGPGTFARLTDALLAPPTAPVPQARTSPGGRTARCSSGPTVDASRCARSTATPRSSGPVRHVARTSTASRSTGSSAGCAWSRCPRSPPRRATSTRGPT